MSKSQSLGDVDIGILVDEGNCDVADTGELDWDVEGVGAFLLEIAELTGVEECTEIAEVAWVGSDDGRTLSADVNWISDLRSMGEFILVPPGKRVWLTIGLSV